MQISIKQLRYFVAVARDEHFGRAAARLHVSQPPITRQVRQLEEQLGVELFIRHAKGVTLTPEGAILLDEAKAILGRVEQAGDRLKRASGGELGRLDIAIFGSAIFGKITQVVRQFRIFYPSVNVVLHTLSKHQQYEALHDRTIDIAFNRMLEPEPGLVIEELMREQLYVAVPDQHPLAGADELTFEQVADYPIILFPSSNRKGFIDKIKHMYAKVGLIPDVAQEVGDSVTGLALVASGFGVCLVPESVLGLSLMGVTFRLLRGPAADTTVDLSCFYRDENRPRVQENFLEIARSFARQ
jgi:DNA-binding transcriptional LysR family regulator